MVNRAQSWKMVMREYTVINVAVHLCVKSYLSLRIRHSCLIFGFWHFTSKPWRVKDQENILTSGVLLVSQNRSSRCPAWASKVTIWTMTSLLFIVTSLPSGISFDLLTGKDFSMDLNRSLSYCWWLHFASGNEEKGPSVPHIPRCATSELSVSPPRLPSPTDLEGQGKTSPLSGDQPADSFSYKYGETFWTPSLHLNTTFSRSWG